MTPVDYVDCLNRLKEGDERAFTTIYEDYWDKLYFVAYQKLGTRAAAEEIVQEVFLTLWQKRMVLAIDCLPTYLAAMVRYAIYRHFASEEARRNRETGYTARQAPPTTLGDQLENKLALEKILELSNRLPEKCRLVFQQAKMEDQPLTQVAKKLNISVKTAEAHLTKALKIIRPSIRGFLNLFL